MKQTSIKKLSEVYNRLLIMAEDFGVNAKYNCDVLAEHIKDIIRAEAATTAKVGKFDLYKYVFTGDYRNVLKGVFHEDGHKVATDGIIMVALKEDYDSELEGKIVAPDGSFIDAKFPKWRLVVPNSAQMTPHAIDSKVFYEWLDGKRAEFKAETGKGTRFYWKWVVQIGEACVRAGKFDLMLTAMKQIGATSVYVQDRHHSIIAESPKGLVLLMPILAELEDGNVCTLA